jgi:Flp pilus assembly protein TadD
MSLQRLSVFLAAMIAVLAGTPADAAWHEARTAHFQIYGDMKPDAIRWFAMRLERFDKALRLARDAPDDPRMHANPLTVFVLSDPAAVAKLCGQSCINVAGFYRPRISGSIAFTPRRAGGGGQFDLKAETVLLHEYTHHFMLQNFPAAYPAWFVEGFAEFNSTATVLKDGSMQFGAAPMYRAYSLLHNQLPLERVLGSAVYEIRPQLRDDLYGQGWLLTHYLLSEPSRRGQLATYLTKLNAGQTSMAAAASSFGDLKQLRDGLRDYMKRSTLSAYTIKADALSIGDVAVRALPEGEAAMMPVRIRSVRGVDAAEAAEVVVQARKIAVRYPADAAVQRALAEAEYDAGDPAAAEAAADRALAADPKNVGAMLYKGLALVGRATAAKGDERAAWREARRWFVKANRQENDSAEPLFLFYESFRRAGETPSPAAVTGLLAAFDRSPHDPSVRVLVVRQLLLQGDMKEARATIAPLAFDPHAGKDNIAARVMAGIDAGETGAAIVARMEQPVVDVTASR